MVHPGHGIGSRKLPILLLIFLAIAATLWRRSSERRNLDEELGFWCRGLPLMHTTGTNGLEATAVRDEYGRTYGPLESHAAVAVSSVRAIGTNGLPFLLKTLSAPDSPIETWIERHAVQLNVKRLPFHNRACLRQQAAVALILLSPYRPTSPTGFVN